jgi:site-specific recombinase XerD
MPDQMVAAIEGAGDYSSQKKLFGLIRWTYRVLEANGIDISNPCKRVERLYMADFRPEHRQLETTWQSRMIETARESTSGWKGVRLAAIVAVLCETALKNQELVELRLSDIHGSPPEWLEAGRRGKKREFELTAPTSRVLSEWLLVRPVCDTDLLFVADASGRLMDSATLWRQLKKVTQRVQGGDAVAHYGTGLIRATKAKEMQTHGTSTQAIAKFLGHMQSASTDELLHRVQISHKRSTRRHPV